MVYILLFIVMVMIDQYTKYITNAVFNVGETVAIIEDFFHLTYVENRGIVFGLFQGKIDVVTVFAAVATIFIALYLLKNYKKMSFIEKLSYVMILSGALGNMTDRVFRGYVIDMLDFRGIWSFVFNFADVWINLGVIFLLLDSLYTWLKNRKKVDK